jgi:hypothetical protein
MDGADVLVSSRGSNHSPGRFGLTCYCTTSMVEVGL